MIELAVKVPAIAWTDQQTQPTLAAAERIAERFLSETAVFAERGLEPEACSRGHSE